MKDKSTKELIDTLNLAKMIITRPKSRMDKSSYEAWVKNSESLKHIIEKELSARENSIK